MPKKRKSKEGGTSAEFKVDYRYTPKPYFTAPTTTQNGPRINTSSTVQYTAPNRANPSPSRSPWARPSTQVAAVVSPTKLYAQTVNKTVSPTATSKDQASNSLSKAEKPTSTSELNTKQKDSIRRNFREIFDGQVEPGVINMVLDELNFNENEAYDTLFQLAESPNHTGKQNRLHTGLNGSRSPDRMLTPTAPTLSYTSSMTSLDEYGSQFTTEYTEQNLSQVADALRNGASDDINDLDRQRRARSRNSTPRSALRSGSLLVKNINLGGSTESLESNRSHTTANGTLTRYSTLSSRDGTPKKSNFASGSEKTMSLVDISYSEEAFEAEPLASGARGGATLETARSYPGNPLTAMLIPLEHGDIVIEHPPSDFKAPPTHLQAPRTSHPETGLPGQAPDSQLSGPLTTSASMSAFSDAINSLTDRLDDDVTHDKPELSANSTLTNGDIQATNGAAAGVSREPPVDVETSVQQPRLSPSSSDSWSSLVTNSPYSGYGILSSGSVVPTPLVSVRPKRPLASREGSPVLDNSLVKSIEAGDRVMVLLRGAPGSGKSFLARRLVERFRTGSILGSDDFFYTESGRYEWRADQLNEAHVWNQRRAKSQCEHSVSPIIIDNTNTMAWEMIPYIKICVKFNYKPIMAEPNTSWKEMPGELARRNKHKVPVLSIKRMLDRFERNFTVDQLIQNVNKSMVTRSSGVTGAGSPRMNSTMTAPRADTASPISLNPADRVDDISHSSETALTSEPSRSSSISSISTRSSDTTEDNSSETSSLKLSRRKVTSKTFKRNQQTETVQKFKDKSVESLMSQSLSPSSLLCDQNPADQTEIMFPSGISRKPSVKVTNSEPKLTEPPKLSEPPKLIDTPKHAESRKRAEREKSMKRSPSTESLEPQPSAIPTPSAAQLDVMSQPIEATPELATPILPDSSLVTSSPSQLTPTPSPDNSSSERTPTAEMDTSSSSIQSNQDKVLVDNRLMSQKMFENGPSSDYQTSSLNRQAIGSSKKPVSQSQRRSVSHDVLPLLPAELKSTWMETDWKMPKYPPGPSPTETKIELTAQAVETSEQATLTEPQDYALAYKAMQYNNSLPHGWTMLTAVSRDPFPVPSNPPSRPRPGIASIDRSVLVDLDEEMLSLEIDSLNCSESVRRLVERFPQMKTERLAEVLAQCNGDEERALNVILDGEGSAPTATSRASRPRKPAAGGFRRAISIPDARKIRSLKNKRAVLVNKMSRAWTGSVSGCLGKYPKSVSPLDRRITSQSEHSVDLVIESGLVEQLEAIFNRDSPHHISTPGLALNVTVNRSQAEKLYRSILQSVNNPSSATSSPSGPLPEKPTRTNHLRRKQRQSLRESDTATPGALAAEDTPPRVITADDWSIDVPVDFQSQDEALARRLQAEEVLAPAAAASNGPLPFKQIMDEQISETKTIKAISVVSSPSTVCSSGHISTRLKRQQLYETFPSSDRSYLDNVFNNCGHNLDQTVSLLVEKFDLEPTEPVTVFTAEADGRGSDRSSDRSSEEREADWYDVEDNGFPSEPDYGDFRKEAEFYRRKVREERVKQQAAQEKGNYELSSYYREQAEAHQKKIGQSNYRAAQKIFERNNRYRNRNEIDLHGLHADEAVVFLEYLLQHAATGRHRKLNLITGRGLNSPFGVPKVKKAVEHFLRSRKISFTVPHSNDGLIQISV